MNLIEFNCGECGAKLKVRGMFAGKSMQCPKCLKKISVPAQSGGESQPAAPAPAPSPSVRKTVAPTRPAGPLTGRTMTVRPGAAAPAARPAPAAPAKPTLPGRPVMKPAAAPAAPRPATPAPAAAPAPTPAATPVPAAVPAPAPAPVAAEPAQVESAPAAAAPEPVTPAGEPAPAAPAADEAAVPMLKPAPIPLSAGVSFGDKVKELETLIRTVRASVTPAKDGTGSDDAVAATPAQMTVRRVGNRLEATLAIDL